MRTTLLIFSLSSLILLSCSRITNHKRGPSSLKYPEFELSRNFFFNEDNCRLTQGPYLEREDYEFDEFLNETKITFHASRKVIQQRFNHLNSQNKRLKKRMFLRGEEFILPHSNGEISLQQSFLNSLAHQVELAFKMNVVEFLFYPDFGHGHLYIPKESLESSMETTLANSKLKIVYHTAEKLMMKSGRDKRDPIDYRQFRYRTRNLVGGFDEKASLEVHYAHNNKVFNTLHRIAGAENYERTGGSLYLSASQSGCIGYKHRNKTYFFDISFHH
jgi:hypothetical protein